MSLSTLGMAVVGRMEVPKVPTLATEEVRLSDFIDAVSTAVWKRSEVLMSEGTTLPSILTDTFKVFRPQLYNSIRELNAAPHVLALFRVIRDCAEEVRAVKTPDMRLSDPSLFVVLVSVIRMFGYSLWREILLDMLVAKLHGWDLVEQPNGTRVWKLIES